MSFRSSVSQSSFLKFRLSALAALVVSGFLAGPSPARAQDPAGSPAAVQPIVAPPEGPPPTAGSKPEAPSVESPIPAAPAPAPVATPVVAAKQPAIPDWLRSLSLGGGAILWYYAPVALTAAKQNVDLFFANLLLDGHFGPVSLHVEPRFRDSRLRAYYPGPVWAQEAYVSFAANRDLVIKAGKIYSQFGLFWDNSFYGNVQVYDGLKLDPDYGVSVEGAVNAAGKKGLLYYAQYFVVDGHTNVSLDGRDTISIPGANRRNESILRLQPFVKPTSSVVVTAGASGAFLQAALPTGTNNVYRAAADATIGIKQWSLWGEYSYQNGQTVTAFPIPATAATATTPAAPGQASAHNHYGLLGTQYTWRQLTVRYNVSTGRYDDVSVSEWMQVPAVAVAIGDNLTALGEYVDWRRHAPGGSSIVDRSFNLTLNGHF